LLIDRAVAVVIYAITESIVEGWLAGHARIGRPTLNAFDDALRCATAFAALRDVAEFRRPAASHALVRANGVDARFAGRASATIDRALINVETPRDAGAHVTDRAITACETSFVIRTRGQRVTRLFRALVAIGARVPIAEIPCRALAAHVAA